MIPIRDNQVRSSPPVITWTLIILNCIVFVWDRQGHIFGGSTVFADLTMRPADVVAALNGSGDRSALVTVFTSMFMHADILHIAGNMIFLLVFGSGIEAAFGPSRFGLYYLFWGVVAAATQIAVSPGSTVPTLGASGAIGGVLGAYFLLFPGNKIEMVIPILAFLPVVVSAWVMLGIWFLWQIFGHQEGVANWAHAGGFLAGMLTILILGGRAAILKSRPQQIDYDFR